MTVAKQHLAIWRDTLGEDAETLWSGLQMEVAPPLRASLESKSENTAWRWVAIAASIATIAVGSWSLALKSELSATRSMYLVAMLHEDSSPTRLTALHRLDGTQLSVSVVDELMALVRVSDDPNVQLAALDILLDTGALREESHIRALLKDVRHNRQFIETAIRARTVRT